MATKDSAKKPRKPSRQSDPARTRPLTLEHLHSLGELNDFTPPAEAFDPNGTWTNTYRLWMVQRYMGGSLRLKREPTADGVRFSVDLDVVEQPGYCRRTRAVLECAADVLATPKSWTLTSQILDLDDQPTTGTHLSETGTVSGGRVEARFGRRRRTQKASGPVTSNWSLLGAVQRLGGAKTQPLRFTMLEEMDLVKPGQRLEFREAKEFELASRKLHLIGYQQIGRGVLPWQYWVDKRGRLLFALSGLRALLYDVEARTWMQERLDKARARTKARRKAT